MRPPLRLAPNFLVAAGSTLAASPREAARNTRPYVAIAEPIRTPFFNNSRRVIFLTRISILTPRFQPADGRLGCGSRGSAARLYAFQGFAFRSELFARFFSDPPHSG